MQIVQRPPGTHDDRGQRIVHHRDGQRGFLAQELIQPLEQRVGDRVRAYVVQVRPDGKLDLSAEPLGTARFRDFAETLRQELREAGGFLPFTDKSDADAIADRFGVSKKTFKRAVGTLYKDRVIRIEPDGIALTGQKK